MQTPTSYRCYRQFLADYISANDLSYRSFAGRYSAYLSFPFLSKLLRHNSDGEFTRDVNISCEKLAALLTAMGLNAHEIAHLILVRLEGDQRRGSYKHSSAFSNVLKSFRSDKINQSYLNLFESLESLLTTRKQKVINELKTQLTIECERTSSQLKIQKLRKLLGVL